MLQTLTHNYYSIIDPPNVEELLDAVENANLMDEQEFTWTDGCLIEVERLNLNDNFFDKIGRISGYHYGADEVIAEAFRVLIEIQDEQIDNHPNFEKIKKQRNRDILKSISKILSQARS